MTDLLHDVRYALRGFLRTPAFTVTAVLTLAIGIGANTAIFSALDRLLLRTLPVPAAERLVHVVTDRGDDDVNHNQAYPTFAALRAGEDVFAGVLAAAPLEVALRGAGAASRISGSAVSGEYFRVLGVRPALGRFFADGEDRIGDPRFVAVIGHGFWTRTLGGDLAAVGRELRINDRPFTVIGVAPASFTGLERGAEIDVWLPLAAAGEISDVGRYFDLPTTTWLFVMARLAPGVTRAEADAALAVWDAGRVEAGVQRAEVATRLRDGAGGLTYRADSVATPLTVTMAAVGVLLLIACANVASLLLVRAGGRRREFAVRAALGAGRGRIARQLLIESLLLAGLGGALGLVVAAWAAGLLAGYRTPGGDALALATGLDLRVLGFATVVSLATAVAFGLLPALRASRPDLVAGLKDAGARPGSGARRLGLREGLVAAQVGLSVVLLVAAALLGRTLRNLERIDVGFDPDGVLAASVDVEALARRGGGTSDASERDRLVALYDALAQRVRALPGVESATLATTVWPNPGGSRWSGILLEGYAGPVDDVSFDVNHVGADYFRTLRVPILRGRGIDARDRGRSLVAVINQTMVRRYWPTQDPLGKRIYLGDDTTGRSIEIVGIARDGKYRELREAPRATAYLALAQVPRQFATLLARTRGEPLALAGAVRREVAAIDPGIPVFDVRALRTHVGFARSRERLAAAVIGLFGLVAVALAALGLYGVLAAAVGQRTREIGVRVALGARPGAVTGLFLRRAAVLVGIGGALGTLAAVAASRVMGDLLYGVAPTDPGSFVAAGGALAAAGLVAAFLPARRAARLDPMEALRHE